VYARARGSPMETPAVGFRDSNYTKSYYLRLKKGSTRVKECRFYFLCSLYNKAAILKN
jgi:hypothetical protein